MIPNHWGTAPGILLNLGSKTVIALPGVPHELKGMFTETVVPYLVQNSAKSVLVSRTLKFVGIGESQLVEIVHNELVQQSNPTIAPYASMGKLNCG